MTGDNLLGLDEPAPQIVSSKWKDLASPNDDDEEENDHDGTCLTC